VQKIAKTAEPIVGAIKESVIKSPILYVDESGYYTVTMDNSKRDFSVFQFFYTYSRE